MSLSLISPTHPEDLDGKEDALEVSESGEDQSAEDDVEEQQARMVKRPHDPGKPTRKEIEEHLPTHWPFSQVLVQTLCAGQRSSLTAQEQESRGQGIPPRADPDDIDGPLLSRQREVR